MKLPVSCVLFGVVICCIISCSNASSEETSTEESKSDEDMRECTGQYLKSKGEVEHEVTSSKESSMCLFTMQFAVAVLRSGFEDKTKEAVPDKATCIMDEFDKGKLLDFVLKLGYFQGNKKFSKHEQKTLVDNMKTLGDEKLRVIATACRIGEDELEAIFDKVFD